jgi:hypothetical protein
MRIRSTKPEFWRSKTIAAFDWDTRLVLKALESYVDDNGVGKDSLVIFCADAFPHDLAKSPEICAKIARSLRALCDANLIVRYTVGDLDLVYVRQWKKWQYIDKPNKGRYPRPDGSMDYRDPVDESIGAGQGVSGPQNREDSPELPETFAKSSPKPPEECPQIQSEEQRNRDLKERETREAKSLHPELFALPDDWAPNLTHRAKAKSFGVTDIDTAADAFRDHALAQGRVLSNWDAGFSQWLANPKTRAAERERRTPNGVKPAASDAAYANTQALKDLPFDRLELES